ncbi:hypothetical protein CBOM_04603 [Ceraceosorus bombacis]|uniref:Uncharacterized protein n=1 Tax=Ceraceosorus bombacis TaxID=401625 RepID=A0A0P1A3B9_9BASI|nr:hypothetical protein CBOM_06638 [Ceraceosorus bombacis]CEH18187.1 hypothetical protein CBOM_04603 [Ceraceosorus bombacis]
MPWMLTGSSLMGYLRQMPKTWLGSMIGLAKKITQGNSLSNQVQQGAGAVNAQQSNYNLLLDVVASLPSRALAPQDWHQP